MRTWLILMMSLIFSSSIIAQESVLMDEVKKLTIENDSLKKAIKSLNDSTTILKSKFDALNEENLAKIEQIEKLKLDIENASSKKIKAERDALVKKVDSLETILYKQKIQISKIDSLQHVSEIKGETKTHQLISSTYNEPFDSLISHNSLNSVNRDLLILSKDTTRRKTILNLKAYFLAEQVLYERYSAKNTELALQSLKPLEQTHSVVSLSTRLKDYDMMTSELIKTMEAIIKFDENNEATDEETQKMKRGDVLSILGDYFYNYEFIMTDYPYLAGVISEVMKRKFLNANQNIIDLKKAL